MSLVTNLSTKSGQGQLAQLENEPVRQLGAFGDSALPLADARSYEGLRLRAAALHFSEFGGHRPPLQVTLFSC
jgi:hypothetical protein